MWVFSSGFCLLVLSSVTSQSPGGQCRALSDGDRNHVAFWFLGEFFPLLHVFTPSLYKSACWFYSKRRWDAAVLKGTLGQVGCTCSNCAKPNGAKAPGIVTGRTSEIKRLDAKNQYGKAAGKPRRSRTSVFFTNTSWFLWSCRMWGGNAALCIRSHFPGAPLALQTIRRMSCSPERTFSTSPANLLSKDTSCFPLVYTGKAAPGTRTLGRLFLPWIFQEFGTKHPFTSKRQREINSAL